MAIPKKRKKLAEKTERQTKAADSRSSRASRRAPQSRTLRTSSKKIDGAFDLMSHIEDGDETAAETKRRKQPDSLKKPSSAKSDADRLGFRFHVSLDALMPNKARRNVDKRKQPVEESHVVDIHLTIPFLWDIPIIGELSQKIFKNFKTIKF